MEGLVVLPDLNDTKCDLAHRNTTWNKRVAISKKSTTKKTVTWHVVVHNFKRLFWWSEKGKLPNYLYLARSLHAFLLGLLYSHTLILSRSKEDRASNPVFLPSKNTGFLSSPPVTDPDVSPSAGEAEEGQRLGRRRQRGRRHTAGRTVISGRAPTREVLRSLHRCPSVGESGLPPPTYPHPDDLQVYLRSKPP